MLSPQLVRCYSPQPSTSIARNLRPKLAERSESSFLTISSSENKDFPEIYSRNNLREPEYVSKNVLKVFREWSLNISRICENGNILQVFWKQYPQIKIFWRCSLKRERKLPYFISILILYTARTMYVIKTRKCFQRISGNLSRVIVKTR